MPKRTDLKKILIIGSGPIIIGQACEFDYSGTQACKALREEGYRVVLVNSNPATIMTDKETADRVYIEPMDLPHLEAIIALEKEMITEALIKNMWNKTRAAKDLGISRVCLIGKIYSYKLERFRNSAELLEEMQTPETAEDELGLI